MSSCSKSDSTLLTRVSCFLSDNKTETSQKKNLEIHNTITSEVKFDGPLYQCFLKVNQHSTYLFLSNSSTVPYNEIRLSFT